jgi:3D (Asp-Asp-Asp) domain-containing protein
VEDIGFKTVNDCMAVSKINQWDVWVTDYKEEKKFDKKFGHKKLHIWLIQKEK